MPIADYFIRGFEAQKQAQQAAMDNAFRLRQLKALQDYRNANLAIARDELQQQKDRLNADLEYRDQTDPFVPAETGAVEFGPDWMRTQGTGFQPETQQMRLSAATAVDERRAAQEARERANQPIPVPKFLQNQLGPTVAPANRQALGAIYSAAGNANLMSMQPRGGGGAGAGGQITGNLARALELKRLTANDPTGDVQIEFTKALGDLNPAELEQYLEITGGAGAPSAQAPPEGFEEFQQNQPGPSPADDLMGQIQEAEQYAATARMSPAEARRFVLYLEYLRQQRAKALRKQVRLPGTLERQGIMMPTSPIAPVIGWSPPTQ